MLDRERGCCGVILHLGNRGVAHDESTFIEDDAGYVACSSNFLPCVVTAHAIR